VELVEVWVTNELPTSGRRYMEVVKKGWKWVRIRDPFGDRRCSKIKRRTFDQILVQPCEAQQS
jgi:hypothetical protein